MNRNSVATHDDDQDDEHESALIAAQMQTSVPFIVFPSASLCLVLHYVAVPCHAVLCFSFLGLATYLALLGRALPGHAQKGSPNYRNRSRSRSRSSRSSSRGSNRSRRQQSQPQPQSWSCSWSWSQSQSQSDQSEQSEIKRYYFMDSFRNMHSLSDCIFWQPAAITQTFYERF